MSTNGVTRNPWLGMQVMMYGGSPDPGTPWVPRESPYVPYVPSPVDEAETTRRIEMLRTQRFVAPNVQLAQAIQVVQERLREVWKMYGTRSAPQLFRITEHGRTFLLTLPNTDVPDAQAIYDAFGAGTYRLVLYPADTGMQHVTEIMFPGTTFPTPEPPAVEAEEPPSCRECRPTVELVVGVRVAEYGQLFVQVRVDGALRDEVAGDAFRVTTVEAVQLGSDEQQVSVAARRDDFGQLHVRVSVDGVHVREISVQGSSVVLKEQL